MNWSCVERLSCCSVVTVSVNLLYVLSCFCSVRVETYLCVCVCLCCCCVVFKSAFVLNHFECVDLFAVSLPTEEVMSHFQFQRWLITNFKQIVRVMLDLHFCPRPPSTFLLSLNMTVTSLIWTVATAACHFLFECGVKSSYWSFSSLQSTRSNKHTDKHLW